MSLSDQQKKFVRLLVIDGKTNGQAYQEAGYSCKDLNTASAAATRLLKKVKIQEYKEQLQSKIEKEAVLDAAHFAKRLERFAQAAENAAFASEKETGDTLDVSAKEAADIARNCSIDAARLLGELVNKSETTLISHEDRLAALREKLNGRHSDTSSTH